MSILSHDSELVPPDLATTHCVYQAGAWFVRKARAQARLVGVQQAALNLRKQGVRIELALLILRRSA